MIAGNSKGAADHALTSDEREEVKQRANPRAIVVHEVIREEGQVELRRPIAALAWSGFAAGLSMSFSMVADGLLRAALPDEPWRPLVSSFGYSLGFLIVILGRQQLFTESTLTAVLPVLYRRNGGTLAKMLRLWAIVFVANIAGTLLFAWVAAHGHVFKPPVQHEFVQLGRHAMENGFIVTVLKAMLAGWLIATLVWLLPAAGSAKLLIIVVITYIVGVASLPHIIAGSSEASFAVMAGAAGWGDYFLSFLVPTLIGNTIGGVLLVAVLNHAQVSSELESDGG